MTRKILATTMVLILASFGTASAKVKKLRGGTSTVVISLPGSYILDGNITVPDENTSGIVVGVDNVTIDLNGFTIKGPATCSGFPTSCAPVGTGIGIDASSVANTVVYNGTITGMTGGAYLGTGARVERVAAVGNGAAGIVAGFFSSISDCIARLNGGSGIFSYESIVKHSVATYNGGMGIYLQNGVIQGNVVNRNGDEGVYANGATVVTGNLAMQNSLAGIRADLGGNVTNNASWGNGGVGLMGGAVVSAASGLNQFDLNNGGNANPQTSGVVTQTASNQCGYNLSCP